jgi:hypothetical protein
MPFVRTAANDDFARSTRIVHGKSNEPPRERPG